MPIEPDPKQDDNLPIHQANTVRLVLISGCSGGGKSSLLAELGRRGHAIVEEPGRRIVREQLAAGGKALPWTGPRAFVELALARSIENWECAQEAGGLCFFDRGIVDAANWFLQNGLELPLHFAGAVAHCRYDTKVFLVPPWKEIFVTDAERKHGFENGVAEYDSLLKTLPAFGYEVVLLPKTSVAARADFVLETLNRT